MAECCQAQVLTHASAFAGAGSISMTCTDAQGHVHDWCLIGPCILTCRHTKTSIMRKLLAEAARASEPDLKTFPPEPRLFRWWAAEHDLWQLSWVLGMAECCQTQAVQAAGLPLSKCGFDLLPDSQDPTCRTGSSAEMADYLQDRPAPGQIRLLVTWAPTAQWTGSSCLRASP